jgi:GDP-4-dehydro-6-deoxy-D-mannose reductase
VKALITGANGFVGSHLAEYLLDHTDWDVSGTVYGDIANVAHLNGRIRMLDGGITEPAVCREVLEAAEPDYVFHLAAQSLPSEARRDPWPSLATNIRMQLNVLRGVLDLGLQSRVLVVGSSEQYGRIDSDQLPIDESSPFRPLNAYAVSKVAQEMLGLQFHLAHGLPVMVVRPFNHIGPRQRLGFVAPDFAYQVAMAEAGQRVPVVRVGNLDVSRDFSDVQDVIRGYHRIMTSGEPGQAYNLCSGRAHSISELLNLMVESSTVKLTVEQDSARRRKVDVPVVIGDYRKLRERTGWTPAIPFEKSVARVLHYWRQKLEQCEKPDSYREITDGKEMAKT